MASKAAQKRLTKEYVAMQKEPPPFVWAVPDEKNILTWNYLIRGPPDTPFAGGEYHGVLLFPSEYPFKPPGIKMLTPSGRFQPDKKICFSMSDFHPGSWNPAWSVATILTGLLSFMLSDEMTTGSVTSSDTHKRAFAARSHSWNISQARFREAFTDYCTSHLRDLPNMGPKDQGNSEMTSAKLPLMATCPTSTSISGTISGINSNASLVKPIPSSASSSVSRAKPESSLTPLPSSGGSSSGKPEDNRIISSSGWAGTWGQIIWEKWRWGVLIAVAVVVSRFSSGA